MSSPLLAERYARAERLCEWNVRDRVRNASIVVRWQGDEDRFWYERQEPEGTTIVEVDAAGSTRELTAAPPEISAPEGRLRSPDGAWDLFARDGNLLIAAAGGEELRALTTDGEPDNGYGVEPGSSLPTVSRLPASRQQAVTSPVAFTVIRCHSAGQA